MSHERLLRAIKTPRAFVLQGLANWRRRAAERGKVIRRRPQTATERSRGHRTDDPETYFTEKETEEHLKRMTVTLFQIAKE